MSERPRTAIDIICNRHIARMMENLEQAECPMIYRDAVKREMQWCRNDLNEAELETAKKPVRKSKWRCRDGTCGDCARCGWQDGDDKEQEREVEG